MKPKFKSPSKSGFSPGTFWEGGKTSPQTLEITSRIFGQPALTPPARGSGNFQSLGGLSQRCVDKTLILVHFRTDLGFHIEGLMLN